MSTAHYGRAVPLALRRFRRLPCVFHPRTVPPPLPSIPVEPIGAAPQKVSTSGSQAAASIAAAAAKQKDSKRADGGNADVTTGSTEPATLELPKGLPPGAHVLLLLSRRKHIEHTDSWLSVREAWERLLLERGVHQEGEMQMYIVCLMPRFWPLRWLWRRRMSEWYDLLGHEEYPMVHLLETTAWSDDFHEKMCIHDDGRAYAMVIRNDGEIIWASHDKFKEHLQENLMVRTVNRECEFRIMEQERLLGAKKTVAAIGGEVVKPIASDSAATDAKREQVPAAREGVAKKVPLEDSRIE